jgi:hypothetical protein
VWEFFWIFTYSGVILFKVVSIRHLVLTLRLNAALFFCKFGISILLEIAWLLVESGLLGYDTDFNRVQLIENSVVTIQRSFVAAYEESCPFTVNIACSFTTRLATLIACFSIKARKKFENTVLRVKSL